MICIFIVKKYTILYKKEKHLDTITHSYQIMKYLDTL